MKYKRLEDEGTLRGKLHKFNIHSIRKKGDRFAGYLKILTGVEPQVKKANKNNFLSSSHSHCNHDKKRGVNGIKVMRLSDMIYYCIY